MCEYRILEFWERTLRWVCRTSRILERYPARQLGRLVDSPYPPHRPQPHQPRSIFEAADKGRTVHEGLKSPSQEHTKPRFCSGGCERAMEIGCAVLRNCASKRTGGPPSLEGLPLHLPIISHRRVALTEKNLFINKVLPHLHRCDNGTHRSILIRPRRE